MAAARKKPSSKSPASKKPTSEQREAAKQKAKQSAAKGGKKSADAKKSASTRAARPTNPDAMEPAVIELITAIDVYKRKYQRPFPGWSEILEIVKSLGYSKSA